MTRGQFLGAVLSPVLLFLRRGKEPAPKFHNFGYFIPRKNGWCTVMTRGNKYHYHNGKLEAVERPNQPIEFVDTSKFIYGEHDWTYRRKE